MAIRLPVPVRGALAFPIRRLPFPILGGPNRGALWSASALGRGVLTGRYESRRFRLLRDLIREGDRVWDVGAHRGYATLIAGDRVGPGGSVVAFEPAAVNRWYVDTHIRWNRVPRVRVLPFALGSADGESTIGGAGSSVSFAVGEGSEPVRVRSVASLLRHDGLVPPTLLKIDVEGAEGEVLSGARDALGPGVAILLSLHSPPAHARCERLLRDAGFTIHASPELRANLAGEYGRWYGDPHLVAVGRERNLPPELLSRYDLA